jgi:hypothetical protein
MTIQSNNHKKFKVHNIAAYHLAQIAAATNFNSKSLQASLGSKHQQPNLFPKSSRLYTLLLQQQPTASPKSTERTSKLTSHM